MEFRRAGDLDLQVIRIHPDSVKHLLYEDAVFRFGGFIPDRVHIQVIQEPDDLLEPLDCLAAFRRNVGRRGRPQSGDLARFMQSPRRCRLARVSGHTAADRGRNGPTQIPSTSHYGVQDP